MNEKRLHRGSTLLLPGTHQDPEKCHICVVLNEPRDSDGRQILYVPIITAKRKHDKTCTLDVGDHPFIKHKSCVHYAAMGQRSEAHLLKVGIVRESLQPEILRTIIDGVMASPHSPPWTKEFIRSLLDDEEA